MIKILLLTSVACIAPVALSADFPSAQELDLILNLGTISADDIKTLLDQTSLPPSEIVEPAPLQVRSRRQTGLSFATIESDDTRLESSDELESSDDDYDSDYGSGVKQKRVISNRDPNPQIAARKAHNRRLAAESRDRALHREDTEKTKALTAIFTATKTIKEALDQERVTLEEISELFNSFEIVEKLAKVVEKKGLIPIEYAGLQALLPVEMQMPPARKIAKNQQPKGLSKEETIELRKARNRDYARMSREGRINRIMMYPGLAAALDAFSAALQAKIDGN